MAKIITTDTETDIFEPPRTIYRVHLLVQAKC